MNTVRTDKPENVLSGNDITDEKHGQWDGIGVENCLSSWLCSSSWTAYWSFDGSPTKGFFEWTEKCLRGTVKLYS